MKIEIEQAIHNLAVEGMTLDQKTLDAIAKFDKDEISFEQFKEIIFTINGVNDNA